jgi:hypothetical protein
MGGLAHIPGFMSHDTSSDGADQTGVVGLIEAEKRFKDAGLVTSVLVLRIQTVLDELGRLDYRYPRIPEDRNTVDRIAAGSRSDHGRTPLA